MVTGFELNHIYNREFLGVGAIVVNTKTSKLTYTVELGRGVPDTHTAILRQLRAPNGGVLTAKGNHYGVAGGGTVKCGAATTFFRNLKLVLHDRRNNEICPCSRGTRAILTILLSGYGRLKVGVVARYATGGVLPGLAILASQNTFRTSFATIYYNKGTRDTLNSGNDNCTLLGSLNRDIAPLYPTLIRLGSSDERAHTVSNAETGYHVTLRLSKGVIYRRANRILFASCKLSKVTIVGVSRTTTGGFTGGRPRGYVTILSLIPRVRRGRLLDRVGGFNGLGNILNAGLTTVVRGRTNNSFTGRTRATGG